MKPFKKILVPTDFSEGARMALDRALDLRERFHASVTLLHVYQLPIAYGDGYFFTPDILGGIEEGAKNELAKMKAEADQRAQELADAPISSKLLLGTPVLTIVEEAQSGAYDLIVMGTHGRSGLSRMVMGSVAERVVRTAPCPVLTVR